MYDDYIKSGLAEKDYERESTGNFFIMDELPDQEQDTNNEQEGDADSLDV